MVDVAVAMALLVGPVAAQALPPVPRPSPPLGHLNNEQYQALIAVNASFNAIRTLRGEFIQIGPTDNALSEGVFFMARPGRVRFEYYPPSQLLIISNGATVSIENRQTRTRDRYPLRRTPLAPLLADYTDLTDEENIRDVTVDTDLISVVLVENDGGGWLTLFFDKVTFELRQWVTIDQQGYTITFVIYNLALNQPIDDALFEIVD